MSTKLEHRQVRIRLKMYKIHEIDLKSHNFTCNFFLEASWLDDEIDRKDITSTEQQSEKWENQFPYRPQQNNSELRWTPRLNFGNNIQIDPDDREDWYSCYTKDAHGNEEPFPVVVYKVRAIGTFHTNYNLESFPFDAQDLKIVIQSSFFDAKQLEFARICKTFYNPLKTCFLLLRRNSQQHLVSGQKKQETNNLKQSSTDMKNRKGDRIYNVQIIKNSNPIYASVVPNEDSFYLSGEYTLCNEIVGIEERTDENMSSSKLVYPMLTFAVKIQRRPNFYFVNVVLPMFLICLLGFPCLLLNASELNDRLGIVLTLLLTAIAYKAYLADMCPKTSYTTWIDKYIICCTLLLTCLGIESAFMFWLSSWDQGTCWNDKFKSKETESCDETSKSFGCMIYEKEDFVGGLLAFMWCLTHFWYMLRMICCIQSSKTKMEIENDLISYDTQKKKSV